MSDYINGLLSAGDIIAEDISLRKELVRNATSTKSVSYVSINPDLSVHPMYMNDIDADDGLRIQCTRLRVSSHRLKVETGRWARINAEDRLYSCGRQSRMRNTSLLSAP